MAFMSLTPSYSVDPAQNLLSTGTAGEKEMYGNSGSRESGKAEHKRDPDRPCLEMLQLGQVVHKDPSPVGGSEKS